MYNIFAPLNLSSLNVSTYLLCLVFSLLCGALVALGASIKQQVSKSFIISLVLLPPIVQTVIMMVNGNIGTGVAVMGAFSLVRFRSVPGKAREIAAIFLAMTSGLACAAGYVGVAVIFSLIVSVITVVLNLLPLIGEHTLELRITIPESLNFEGEFDDVLEKYTKSSKLVGVKTTNMGSLFKLTYRIVMKNRSETKSFMDELRCRNGNLEISIFESPENHEEM